jgi:predicted 3-demethylubiquinone-9 3-methyltransferase (glyoxalase superfamily)
MDRITPCLWFDTEAEEAAQFYTSVFRNSRIVRVTHYGSSAMLQMRKIVIDELERAADGVLAR